MVEQEQIAQILSGREIEDAARTLLQTALDRGGNDNITIILCRIAEEPQGLLSKMLYGILHPAGK